ncbi:pentapeptide repeat-containing protein [Brachyspira intermedia]|uniref:pentapeptide repeat-containing protein n=1 Tax=Brachyspira intermedia TaxID=84377 RepID=UPI0030043740
MIKLNVDEIEGYGITEQPIEYNSEEELIKWLEYDLLQQALINGKEADENNIITITDEEKEYYTLNIGIRYDKNNTKNKIIINFDFCIIKYQGNINCHNIIFNKKIYGHDKYEIYKMLNNKIDFSNSIFNDIVDFTGAIFYNFSIDFSNCLFKDIVKLEGSKFYGGVNSNLYFNDSIFEKKNNF